MDLWEWYPHRRDFTQLTGAAADRAAASPVVVADSWLVTDGTVRAFARHRERFSLACRNVVQEDLSALSAHAEDQVADAVRAKEFWTALTALVPSAGDWFPRVELVAGDHEGLQSLHLCFRVRPAPARSAGVVVWIPEQTDPRSQPRIKGPDLPVLTALRGEGQAHGADEVLLLDDHGQVVEAANANVLWWDGDTLCAPESQAVTFGGVTAGLVIEEARCRSITVESRRVKPADLVGYEVWLTNALHGIRAVTGWRGAGMGETAPAPGDRAPAWQQWWNSLG